MRIAVMILLLIVSVPPNVSGGQIVVDTNLPTNINPANKLIRKRKDLAVAEEATIVNGIGAIACLVRSGIVGSKESSDGHRVTRWTL